MSTVTICIPAYNCESTICDAVDSVIQNYDARAQILIINNASTDDTSIVNRKYKNQIEYIENIRNIGFAENFKKCIRFARGKYLTFIGGDDILLNGVLLNIVEWMGMNPTVGLVGSDIRVFVDDPNNPTRKCKFGTKEIVYSAGAIALTEWWLSSTLASIGGWVVNSDAAKMYVDQIPSHTIIPQCYLGFYIAQKYDVGYLPVSFFTQRLSNSENQLANLQYSSISTFENYHSLVSQLDNDEIPKRKLFLQLSKMICENLISFAAFGNKHIFYKAFRYAVFFDKSAFFNLKYLFFLLFGFLLPKRVMLNMMRLYRKVK